MTGFTQTLERTETDAPATEQDSHDPNKVRHYFRKVEILEGAVLGAAAVALCGYVKVPLRTGEGLPICPECQDIYDNQLTD